MNINSIGATGAIGSTGSIGSIGVTSANPYIIGAHSECHQYPPSIGCGR